jgi:alcohol dehydrogenase class IV
MDALTHAVESYTSRKANPLTDMYALDAIKRIFAYLPAAYADGGDLKAREEMADRGLRSRRVHQTTRPSRSCTACRGRSGALHVSHGISNAMLLQECLAYALDGCYRRFGDIGRAIGAAGSDACDEEAANAFMAKLGELCDTLNIRRSGRTAIDEDAFSAACDKMAGDAMASGSPGNTVKEVTKADLMRIYQSSGKHYLKGLFTKA